MEDACRSVYVCTFYLVHRTIGHASRSYEYEPIRTGSLFAPVACTSAHGSSLPVFCSKTMAGRYYFFICISLFSLFPDAVSLSLHAWSVGGISGERFNQYPASRKEEIYIQLQAIDMPTRSQRNFPDTQRTMARVQTSRNGVPIVNIRSIFRGYPRSKL